MKLITNFIVDAIVFFGFLIVNEHKITTQAIHEWLGLAIFVTLLFHLFLHWQWVVNKVVSFFKRMALLDRINFIVDFLIFTAIIAVTLSGVLMSKSALPALGITLPRSGAWKQLHSLSAQASLYLLALHFALHWSWIAAALKRFVFAPIGRLFRRSPVTKPLSGNVENDQARVS
jgi:hypothetical protein